MTELGTVIELRLVSKQGFMTSSEKVSGYSSDPCVAVIVTAKSVY